MCLAQGLQRRSDAGKAQTRAPSVSSQALYNCAPSQRVNVTLYALNACKLKSLVFFTTAENSAMLWRQ